MMERVHRLPQKVQAFGEGQLRQVTQSKLDALRKHTQHCGLTAPAHPRLAVLFPLVLYSVHLVHLHQAQAVVRSKLVYLQFSLQRESVVERNHSPLRNQRVRLALEEINACLVANPRPFVLGQAVALTARSTHNNRYY